MGLFKGGFLRIAQSLLYALLFCCSVIMLGIYSYFLATLANRDLKIPRQWQAVEGISGAAVLYLIMATLFTCCLGGIAIFAFLAIVLDVLFCGAMIAVAVLTRQGAKSCSGNVRTPIGYGPATAMGVNGDTFLGASLRAACKMNSAVFAVSIIAAILFLVTAAMQLLLVRNRKKEKRHDPGANDYTSDSGSNKKQGGMFARKNKNRDMSNEMHEKDPEVGTAIGTNDAALLAAAHHDIRPSHDSTMTGSTAAAPGNASPYNKFAPIDPPHHDELALPHGAPPATHGNYYSQPQSTGINNPYGYDNATTTTHTSVGPNAYQTGTATNY
ncbi:hypothetical protein LTR10_009002 [Elasticomyces elasticus]|nr:hypothetical protein LTR10_009002 [Elasticomyces elasticus]KAK4964772.1 hypothetical protein LTR42_012716 [Elasticomyces elasticus]